MKTCAAPSRFLSFAHVLIGKPVPTFPGHALMAKATLDLEFRRGEFLGVVGPSGCGKSTLLEIIAGLVTPTSGTIEMEGRDITGTVADEIGVVFQEDATF